MLGVLEFICSRVMIWAVEGKQVRAIVPACESCGL